MFPNKYIFVIVFTIFHGGDFMLVLGRKPGQYVVINGEIIVKVVKSTSGDLRLAIEAPKDMKITRGEVCDKLNESN